MAIKINWKDLQKRIINGKEVEKVILNWVQIRPESTPILDDYLCFTANSMPSVVRLSFFDGGTAVYEYSKDKINWTDYIAWDRLLFSNVWDKFYIRCKTVEPQTFRNNDRRFYMAWSISASGDIWFLVSKNSTDTLVFWQGASDYTTFKGLFRECDALTTPPRLPATTLSAHAYEKMFYGCTNLTTAPQLPATTLTDSCYTEMFRDCTSLTTPPELPATTLGYDCYWAMFYGCTSLTTAPRLQATTFSGEAWCYNAMFYWCTNLTTLPALPITNMWEYCYWWMFNWCSKIKLSETQTWDYQTPYRIPVTWTWVHSSIPDRDLEEMFIHTWWTFTGTPNLNQTYYTSNQVL